VIEEKKEIEELKEEVKKLQINQNKHGDDV
jgi:hypothetical protein